MTGEMNQINQDGKDSNGEYWLLHAAIAEALNGKLRPFDAYQGPYIQVNNVKLWVCPDEQWPEYEGRIYNENTGTLSTSFPYEMTEHAIIAANSVLPEQQ